MKRILLAATALIAISTAATAADNVVINEGAAAYNWSGVYVGAATGFNKLSLQDLNFDDERYSDGGFAGAIYAGYNHQMGDLVLGVEADLKYSSGEVPEDPAFITYDSKWGASLRARAGYSVGNIMPYLTGGLAVASFEGDHNDDGTNLAKETVTGYAVGGGIEWAATQNLLVRAEYIYSDYGTNEFAYAPGDIPDVSDVHHVDLRTHDLRVGVAYKF